MEAINAAFLDTAPPPYTTFSPEPTTSTSTDVNVVTMAMQERIIELQRQSMQTQLMSMTQVMIAQTQQPAPIIVIPMTIPQTQNQNSAEQQQLAEERERAEAIAELGRQLDKLFAVAIVSSILGIFICGIPGAYFAEEARKKHRSNDIDAALLLGKRAYYLTMFAMSSLIVVLIPVIVVAGICCNTCCSCYDESVTVEVTRRRGIGLLRSSRTTRVVMHESNNDITEVTCIAAKAVSTMGLSYWCHVADPPCCN